MAVPTGGARIRLEGSRLFTRLAIVILVVVAAAFGAAAGLLFVYSSDLPQVGRSKITIRMWSPSSTGMMASRSAALLFSVAFS